MKCTIFLITLFLFLFLVSGNATTIVDHKVMDAQYLKDNATFNSRQPTLVSNYLEFKGGSTGSNILIRMPMVDSNVLPTDASAKISIIMNATAQTSDNDLWIGVSDGTDVVVGARADNTGWSSWWVTGTDEDSYVAGTANSQFLTNTGFSQIFQIDIILDTTISLTAFLNGHTATANPSPCSIERNAALDLVIMAGDPGEMYNIYSIETIVSTEGTPNFVPEPATISLVIIVGIFVLFKFKK